MAKQPKVSDTAKQQIKAKADELVETTLKPTHIQPPPEEPSFNYLSDISTQWYRNYFYFCATYQCPEPNAISPSFEVKFARMTYLANGHFNMAYMRHTGQWVEIYSDLDLEECLNIVQEDPLFMP